MVSGPRNDPRPQGPSRAQLEQADKLAARGAITPEQLAELKNPEVNAKDKAIADAAEHFIRNNLRGVDAESLSSVKALQTEIANQSPPGAQGTFAGVGEAVDGFLGAVGEGAKIGGQNLERNVGAVGGAVGRGVEVIGDKLNEGVDALHAADAAVNQAVSDGLKDMGNTISENFNAARTGFANWLGGVADSVRPDK